MSSARARISGKSQAAIMKAVDKALDIHEGAVRRHVQRMRRNRPHASDAELIRALEKQYVATVTASGAAVGASAAAPGVGTGVAAALNVGEFTAYMEATALFVLAVADVHGIPVHDLERRRTLVLAVMLGNGGTQTVEQIAQRAGQHWGRKAVQGIPIETIRAINKVLGRNFVTKYGTKQGIVVLGRAIPFGIGAAIGGGANAAMGTGVTKAARRAFGAPPAGPGPVYVAAA